MRTGKILSRILVPALLLAVLTLFAACTDDSNPIIGLMAAYTGPDVTTTDHEFTKDEFFVVVSYEDGTFDQGIKDYEFEVTGLEQGYYILTFTYKGFVTEAYVKCNVAVYPSDLGGGE